MKTVEREEDEYTEIASVKPDQVEQIDQPVVTNMVYSEPPIESGRDTLQKLLIQGMNFENFDFVRLFRDTKFFYVFLKCYEIHWGLSMKNCPV